MAICRISSLEDVKILWSLHDFLYTWDLGLYCQQLEEIDRKLGGNQPTSARYQPYQPSIIRT